MRKILGSPSQWGSNIPQNALFASLAQYLGYLLTEFGQTTLRDFGAKINASNFWA